MLDVEEQRRIHQAYLRICPDPLFAEEHEHIRSSFVERFGPEVLSRLEGIELLNLMFHSRSDSMCYRLASRTNNFGKITQGFDLLFREIKGSNEIDWPKLGVKNMPVEEAIDMALEIRRQLIRGVEILEDLPVSESDELYEGLQKRLDEETPAISRFGWAHKYLSILFPKKLTSFHSEEDQRFYLQKQLQVPPAARGLFTSEGRFISIVRDIASEVNLSLNLLVHSLIELHGKPYRYWRVTQSADGTITMPTDKSVGSWCINLPTCNHKIQIRDIVLFVDSDKVQRISRVEHACPCCNHLQAFLLPADDWKTADGNSLPDIVNLDDQTLTVIETERRLQSYAGNASFLGF